MKGIKVFLPHFRGIIRSLSKGSENNVHPVLYFEDDNFIYFYKPVQFVIYYVMLNKLDLPDNIELEDLKSEFQVEELPEKLFPPKVIEGTIS